MKEKTIFGWFVRYFSVVFIVVAVTYLVQNIGS